MDRVEEEAQAAAQINGENRRWKGQEGAGTLCLHPSASAAMHPMLASPTHRPRPDKRLCAVSQARSRLLQTHMHAGVPVCLPTRFLPGYCRQYLHPRPATTLVPNPTVLSVGPLPLPHPPAAAADRRRRWCGSTQPPSSWLYSRVMAVEMGGCRRCRRCCARQGLRQRSRPPPLQQGQCSRPGRRSSAGRCNRLPGLLTPRTTGSRRRQARWAQQHPRSTACLASRRHATHAAARGRPGGRSTHLGPSCALSETRAGSGRAG